MVRRAMYGKAVCSSHSIISIQCFICCAFLKSWTASAITEGILHA